MAFKIPVEDRVPTYPGRVTLTPVSGSENTFDMVRADMPISEGTPVNSVLFDHKTDRLTEDATIYVSSIGSDLNGDGSVDLPFLTIQAAIDALPKYLDGHTIIVDIESGTYEERVVCKGFTGGKLQFGAHSRSVTIQGIEIDNCSFVELNVSRITAAEDASQNLLKVLNGSNVYINQSVKIDGGSRSVSGISATYNSTISSINGITVTTDNCGGNGIVATNGSTIALYNIAGDNNFSGLYASMGGVISYEAGEVLAFLGNGSSNGGRIWTGEGTVLSVASVEG